MIEKFKILGNTFKDIVSFETYIKDKFEDFKKDKTKIKDAELEFLEFQRLFFENEIQEFLKAVEQTAWLPPLAEAIPLLYVAKWNLESLPIKVNTIIHELRKTERLNFKVANDTIYSEIAIGNNKTGSDGLKQEEERLQRAYLFQNKVMLPLLYHLMSAFRIALEDFLSFYGVILSDLEVEKLHGEETAYQMAINLANIKSEEDLFAFININSAGDLIDKLAYKNVKESDFTPEQLAAIFYYLRDFKVITLENDRALSRHISLISGISHNTIYQALKKINPNKEKLKSSILTEVIGGEKNRNAEEIIRVLNRMKEKISEDVIKFHSMYS